MSTTTTLSRLRETRARLAAEVERANRQLDLDLSVSGYREQQESTRALHAAEKALSRFDEDVRGYMAVMGLSAEELVR